MRLGETVQKRIADSLCFFTGFDRFLTRNTLQELFGSNRLSREFMDSINSDEPTHDHI